jgi:hypothetical protein
MQYNARAKEIAAHARAAVSRHRPSLLARPAMCHICGVWMGLGALSTHTVECEAERERRFMMLPPEMRPLAGYAEEAGDFFFFHFFFFHFFFLLFFILINSTQINTHKSPQPPIPCERTAAAARGQRRY